METRGLGKIRNVSLYGSRQQEGHISAIWDLVVQLQNAGIQVNIEKKLAEVLEQEGYRLSVHGIKTVGRLPEATDLAVSVGGDGTFLRTAKWLAGREIPILGINTGHLGFLAENSTSHISETVSLISGGNALVERRIMLEVECAALPASAWTFALNEIAFLKGAASMIDIKVEVDGFNLATYRADGLLVATPTGSTAYNLSVGGPILAPTLDNMVLAPIAPHTFTLRPVVLAGNSIIHVEVESRAHDFRLSIDGRSYNIPCGEKVKVRKAGHQVLTIRKLGDNFASTLRTKLLWGH